MADEDLATRAPENDAAEDAAKTAAVGVSGTAKTAQTTTTTTTTTEQGPALCEDCVTDRPTPAGLSPQGEVRPIGDVDAYVAKPPGYPRGTARLLLLLTGGTGLTSTNNQLQADAFAAAGFVVVMPDLFGGDVAPNAAVEDTSDNNTSSFGLRLFRTKAAETVKSFLIDMWLARHTEEKVLPLLRRVLAAARDEFADAVAAGGGGVYAAGYCFGGRYVLLLGKELKGEKGESETTTATATTETSERSEDLEASPLLPPLKAGAVAHATLVSPGDFDGIEAPLTVVCVEDDPMFPDAVREAGEDSLDKNNVEHEVQVYPGVPHGFAVVGDYADENIKEAQTTAFEQMKKWLLDH